MPRRTPCLRPAVPASALPGAPLPGNIGAFEHGGNESVEGAGEKDRPRASEGIREVRKGIRRPAAATSVIRSDLKAK